jgi:hypothetical protein
MRTRHHLAIGLVVALSGATLAGPALAQSGPDRRSPDAIDAAAGAVHSPAAVVPTQDRRSPDAADAATPVVPASPGETTIVSSGASQPAASSGFDWGSAAIGAAGAIGLVAVALGSALAVHRRHTPVPPAPVA